MTLPGTQFIGDTLDDLYIQVIQDLMLYGAEAIPRGRRTKEFLGVQLVLKNPGYNVLCHPARNLNYPFSIAEWIWIMLGSNDGKLIVPYNKNIAEFANESMFTFDGAYGPRFIQQLPFVLESLTNDPESRQAVIDIWHPSPRQSKDTPCTLSMQFIARDNDDHDGRELHMITTMRSNDAWLGLPYDIFNFTQIQRYVAMLLSIGVGNYVHNVGSLHLYDTNWKAAAALMQDEWNEEPVVIESPELTRMPKAFQSVAVGLPLMATDGVEQSSEELQRWIGLFHLEEPWQTYLEVMGYRFHKNLDAVPHLYRELIRAQAKHKAQTGIRERTRLHGND